MSYVLNAGDTAPPLVLTATDTAPLGGTGWVLLIYRPDGSVLTDAAPTVDAANPLAVKVSHTWLAGETDQAGVWAVEAERGGRSYPPEGPVRFVITPEGSAAYASVADAQAAGAVGDDATILMALQAAESRVDRYTGDRWAPTPMVLAARVGGDGRTVLLNRRVRSVSAVQVIGTVAPLAPTAYLVLSSATPGQIDAVRLGGAGGSDVLVAGAEPWRGGWSAFLDRGGIGGQVLVTGVFGHDAPPPEVRTATAAIAAWLTQLGAGAAGPAAPAVDDEGNTLTVTISPTPADEPLSRGTGVPAADALLSGLVRRRIRLAG